MLSKKATRKPYEVPSVNEFSEILDEILAKMPVDSATGPDLIPAGVLKTLRYAVKRPLAKVVIAILRHGKWPKGWKLHWVTAIHKRGSKALPGMYRGIHVTAHAAKAVERAILHELHKVIDTDVAFGLSQFAYRRGTGAKDVLALVFLDWISGIDRGRCFAVYCGDVAGAFDRVSSFFLL